MLALVSVSWGQEVTPVIQAENPPNAEATLAKHYVVMVSLDGFRYDYASKWGAPHLDAIAKDGVSTPSGMLPSYPSVTFPNHYTLVTGLRPEHNGMVAMSFFDPARGESYSYNSPTSEDGSWYRGVPLWVLAEKQGMRSACVFWPGSEAKIDGTRPSFYLHFDDKLNNHLRIDQIVSWLKLPEAQRPHLITLYYSDTDHEGHMYGPDSTQTRDAVHLEDALMGELREKLESTGLPVDLIVTTDHGMILLDPKFVGLDQLVDLKGVKTEGVLLYPKGEPETERVYRELKALHDARFDVYRRKEVPRALHYRADANEGDPVVIPRAPYNVKAHISPPKGLYVASHGFDPHKTPEMKGIFYAVGPDIKTGVQLPGFDNVDVYSFVARLLGLTPGKTDGELGVLGQALR
jgi:alkaline phosphatase D